MPDDAPTLERWRGTWRSLGVAAADDAEFRQLMQRYAEPQRAYHTRRHLAECFAHWDAVRAAAERPGEVELALWYHDAVYDPRRGDNEERSAALAAEAMQRAGLDPGARARVHGLILATRHAEGTLEGDAALLTDVDLAILGAPPARFDEYEREVRQEYAWVPMPIFRRKRRAVLEAFLARPRLYATEHFRRTLEPQARANLARSVAAHG